jgi:hypothetical protein
MKISFTVVSDRAKLFFLSLALVALGYQSASAQTNTAVASAAWELPGTWSLGAVPTSSHDVVIPSGRIVFSNSAAVANTVVINGTGILAVQTSSLVVTGAFTQNSGTFNVDAGASVSASSATLRSAGLLGSFSVSGNISILGSTDVDGVGTLTAGTGTITVGTAGSLGTYTSGSATCSGLLTINSGGAININSGTNVTCNGFTVASGASSITLNGNLNIGGGTWTNGGAVSPIGGKVFNFSSLVNSASIALSGTLNGPSQDGITNNQQDSFITNSAVGASISSSGTSNIHVRGTTNSTGFVCGANTFSYTGASSIFTYGASLVNLGSVAENFDNITVSSGSLDITSGAGSAINYIASLTVSSGASARLLVGTYDLSNGSGLSNSGSFTSASVVTLTVFDLVLSNASASFTNNGMLKVFGSFNNDQGTFSSGASSTVDFNGTIGSTSLVVGFGAVSTAFNNFIHSGTLSLAGTGNFSVSGNYNNTSGVADSFTGSTVTFSGTGTLNGGSAGTSFNNITNSSGTRTCSGVVNLKGILSVAGGTFNTGGSSIFTLVSDASGTGSIGALTGTLSGTMTIQRYLSTGTSWKYLSLPFSSTVTVADLQTAGFAVTGHFASGASNGGQLGESFYVWTAGEQAWNGIGWGAAATNLVSLPNTTGYCAYAYAAGASTLSLVGTPARGAIGISINSTGLADNLIPNPYPSALDFKNFAGRGPIGLGMAIQTEGGTGSLLAYYNNGVSTAFPGNPSWAGEIAMGQSFWVTGLSTGTLTLQETDKYSGGSSYFAGKTGSQSPENYVRITLSSGGMVDQSIVRFSSDGSETFNAKLDFVKRLNGNPAIDGQGIRSYLNLSTSKKDSDNPLVFSYLPLLDCNSGAVSVGIKVGDVLPGEHSLKFTDLESFNLGYKITLVDKFMNKQVAVSNGSSYAFTTTDAAATYGAGRFELKFEPQPLAVPTVVIAGTKLTTAASKLIQWYKDGKVITGATSETYTAIESGIYTVKSGYSEKCQAESLPVVLTITGLDKESLISAYPNPAGDIVTVNYPSALKISKVSLYDSKGGFVSDLASLSATESTMTFDVSEKSAGLYILRLKSGNDTYSIKILKK